jgi:hypothetical protein
MPKHSSHIVELAKRGAEARLRELTQEAKYLIELFPHLRDSFDKNELPLSFIIARNSGRLTRKTPSRAAASVRQRSVMSAAARKAVSARMKKYWAAKRKAKA